MIEPAVMYIVSNSYLYKDFISEVQKYYIYTNRISTNRIMRKILLLFLSVILFQGLAKAQFSDTFTDGDFTSNPTWTGDDALYKVNSSFQLQLNSTGTGTASLSSANTLLPDMEWNFWIKLAFAPSDNNLARVYLCSDNADLKGSLNGYYLKFGENLANDAIELVKQTGSTSTVVCRGTDGLIAAAFTIRVKVVRAAGGTWNVYADALGGTNYQLQATGTDNTFTTGSYLGVYSKYTSSNITNFYYDNFYAGPPIVDNTPPEVVSVSLTSPKQVSVTFSEPVEAATATNVNNYSVTPGSILPLSATQDVSNPAIVLLTYSQNFTADVSYTLTTSNVQDPAGNTMLPGQSAFSWHQAKTYDILINEIMADPSPVVNLPDAEYVELYNRSALPVDLKNWVLVLGGSSKILPQYTLPAGGYVILCSTTNKPLLQPFGNVLDFSSFSITNTGATITLKDNYGNVIHTVPFTDKWYPAGVKKDGGWSLELIDPMNPCGEASNWTVCNNDVGGTPGSVNSVNASNPDNVPPALSQAIVNDRTHLTISFTESCDSATILNKANYLIDNGIGNPTSVVTYSPDYKAASLTLGTPLVTGLLYTITSTTNITDCAGNAFLSGSSLQFLIPFPDTISPEVISVSVAPPNKLSVTFSEAVETFSATKFSNYSAMPGSLIPISAKINTSDPSVVDLVFSQRFTPDISYLLNIINVKDISGNIMAPAESSFSWHQAQSFDILINEIMADPSPAVKLPDAEYVELYNRSAFPLELQNWTLLLGSTVKPLPKYTLPAGGYVILCDDSSRLLLQPFGSVIDFSSFAITNTSGTITLKDFDGNVIHTVSYTDDWFDGSYKKDGGWSLELIDPLNPCGEASNWAACNNDVGGTPGNVNSVNASNPDHTPPSISRVGVTDATHITVWFSESCDSTAILNPVNYTIDNGIGNPTSVRAKSPGYKAADLTLTSPISADVIYTLTITSNITDCAGNAFTTENSVRFAIPVEAEANDIVINELLFDPTDQGVDFIEILNRSNKVIDLKDLILANYDTINQVITDYNEISQQPFQILPGEYYVLSTDSSAVKKCYKTISPKAFIDMAYFPSMNNDEGLVALTTKGGKVIDLVAYTSDMQYPLLTNVDGVSLERISPERPSKDVTNWHSASEAVGYATPGYKNSQFGATISDANEITLSPDIFSPDNDGYNDNLSIAYSFNASGNNISITIYDATGRLVRNLVNHELCGTSGAFTWDGITNDRLKASIGRYIVFVEIFDMDGNVKRYKKGTVLGGKL